ncbi:MAG: hypothetical protein ACI9U2_004717 [Bradymonadia bacterium]|jgi:hypothetical protein
MMDRDGQWRQFMVGVLLCGPVLVAGLGGDLWALLWSSRLRRYWSAFGQHRGAPRIPNLRRIVIEVRLVAGFIVVSGQRVALGAGRWLAPIDPRELPRLDGDPARGSAIPPSHAFSRRASVAHGLRTIGGGGLHIVGHDRLERSRG